MTREIQLWRMSGGNRRYRHTHQFTLVDKAQVADEHYDHINSLAEHWSLHPDGYAYRWELKAGRMKNVFMARDVANLMGLPPGKIDHVDPDRILNNQPDNLRLATWPQSQANRRRFKSSSTGEKNISWHKATGKFQVRVYYGGKVVYYALFSDFDDAKKAAEVERQKHHKEFARSK